jgi:RHS repeat-associated protein
MSVNPRISIDAINNVNVKTTHIDGTRYYDPQIERFLGEDPIGFISGDFNIYRYVGNSPVIFNDPSGKKGAKSRKGKDNRSNRSCKKVTQRILQSSVNNACKKSKNSCKGTDSCDELMRKKSLKTPCIIARLLINKICFKGGNKGHKQAIAEMNNGRDKCDKLFKQNKCKPCGWFD